MTNDEELARWVEVLVADAELERDRARLWVLFRSVDYWLWGLDYGLTEDPKRCARLARAFMHP